MSHRRCHSGREPMFGEMHSHGSGGVLPAAEPASCPVLNAHSYILGCVVDRRSQPAWRNHVEPEHTRLENCLAWMVEVPSTSLLGDQIAALGGAGASKSFQPKPRSETTDTAGSRRALPTQPTIWLSGSSALLILAWCIAKALRYATSDASC